jgi:8-oxo-dGTP pyrophosphatase MutT (NUDIX family)
MVVLREAARVLLLDPSGRLLLVEGGDPSAPERGRWWFTPGGGLDPGEDAATGAARELWEETGVTGVTLTGPVAERTAEFDYDGTAYRQHEVFYVARLDDHVEVVPGGLTDLEHRALSGHRWWSVDELAVTGDVVFPEWLHSWLLDQVGAGGD